jgi:hypothetical protein
MEKDKSVIQEVTTNDPITKSDDNPLLKSLKAYFKKEKDIQFIGYESQGDVITIDLRFKFNEDENNAPNDPTLRIAARQQAYDIKRKLEEYLFKEFNISVLSIQGLILKEKTVEFEISFIYKNTGNFKIEYNESTEIKSDLTFKNNKEEIFKEGSEIIFNQKEGKIIELKENSITIEIEGKKYLGGNNFFEDKLTLKENKKKLNETKLIEGYRENPETHIRETDENETVKEIDTDVGPIQETEENDWKIGDKFTTPETGDKIFTVNKVLNTTVEARDARSRAGVSSFDKSYITKVKSKTIEETNTADIDIIQPEDLTPADKIKIPYDVTKS